LRPTLTGQLTRFFTFKLMPDFGNGNVTVPDAYLELRWAPALRIRTGKDKTPVGYELLQGDAFLWFPERSLASGLVPNRDIGVQVLGDLAGSRVSYAIGVFNGVPDGTSLAAEHDSGDAKDLAGRIRVALGKGLGVHLGGSTGNQTGALPAFRTSVGHTYFSYDREAVAAGLRTRVAPALYYYYKSFGAFAEFTQSTQTVARAGQVAELENRGWQISASIIPTGEAVSYGAVRPEHSFNPRERHWGAWQLLARYAAVTVDPGAFGAQLAAATASREARSFTAAANWYPNGNVKYYVTFERTTFDGGLTRRPAQDVIVIRTQLNF
ncbi:MAG TPA: porin, partial [Vicinamibacterales bacterium]|nr:porin [Vicinamibacterales bacterium]